MGFIENIYILNQGLENVLDWKTLFDIRRCSFTLDVECLISKGQEWLCCNAVKFNEVSVDDFCYVIF